MQMTECFATRTEVGDVRQLLDGCLATREFNNFLEEYREYQEGQIKSHEFKIMIENINTLKKNAQTYMTKEEFY